MERSGGYVTTHVLDTSCGQPAEGLTVDVYRWDGRRGGSLPAW